MERLTEKAPGCFGYALKNHMAEPGEFGTYDAYFDYSEAVQRLGEYEDTGLEPEDVRRLQKDWTSLIMTIDEMGGMPHLHEISAAEQEGRLVVLPCKVGDTVYGIKPVKEVDGHLSCEMKHGNVLAFKILENCVLCMVSAKEQFGYPVEFRIGDFGKTVFLTRDESGAALAGEGNEKTAEEPEWKQRMMQTFLGGR